MHSKVVFFIVSCLIFSTVVRGQQSKTILVAAASDLKFALDSVITVFTKEYPGSRIDVTYGSSGKLYEQISHSAPFDLFFSADIEYPSNLKKNGITASEVRSYGVGRLVIWSKRFDPNTNGIHALLENNVSKISIANPKHAPYGRRAEESLKYYKVYDKIKDKLVFGENISQTAQFVTVGAADAGIIALSLALSPQMKKLDGYYYLIPDSAHKSLEQGFVVLQHAKEKALAWSFYEFMVSKEVAAILAYFGFSNNVN